MRFALLTIFVLAAPSFADDLPGLLKEIEAREKELAALKQKAEALKLKPGTVDSLFAGIPMNIRPKDTEDTIRIDRTNDWLAKHATGKIIEFPYEVKSVEMFRSPDKRYRVTMSTPATKQAIKSGVQPAILKWSPRLWPTGGSDDRLVFVNVDDATAEKFADMKGKTVTIRAKVVSAVIEYDGHATVRYLGITIDGIKPPKYTD
jgi:hypothetical protein